MCTLVVHKKARHSAVPSGTVEEPVPLRHMAQAAATIAVLGDDILQEVFILLPTPADLLRAALACQPFLRVARSAAFLRRFRRRHPSTCPVVL